MKVIRFPNSPFELHQPFEAAGDQPQAIKELVEGIEDGLTAQTLLGVTGSGKTYTMANVIARTGLPTLIMAPNKTLAAQLYAEMRDFFPNNAVSISSVTTTTISPKLTSLSVICLLKKILLSMNTSSRCVCRLQRACSNAVM